MKVMKPVILLIVLAHLCYSARIGRIIQVTDPHVDESYTPGAFSDCAALECCRPDSYLYKHGNATAGPQGDFNCDPPVWTLDASLKFAASLADDNSLFFYSGDSPQKDFLNMTQDDIINYINIVSKSLKKHLSAGVPVLPILGNHDSWPIDQLPLPPESDWLFNGAGDAWHDWLAAYPGASDTFAKGGYYVSSFADGKMRVLNLNSLWYDPFNAYVAMNLTGDDPTGQWAWLLGQLDEARTDGAKVWIHAHIPTTAAEMEAKVSEKWCKLAEDYQDVIIAHIFGHVHNDVTTVFMDQAGQGSNVIGGSFQAPSITTTGTEELSKGLNPSVRVYYYDLDTFELIDFDQYRCDLAEANMKNQTCEFFLAYRFSDEFNVPTPINANLGVFYDNLQKNDTALQAFYIAYTTGHPQLSKCDNLCKKQMLCEVGSALKSRWLACQ